MKLLKNLMAGVALAVSTLAFSAPVVVTPGSAAGYLYFPSATTSAAAAGTDVNGGTNKWLFKLKAGAGADAGIPTAVGGVPSNWYPSPKATALATAQAMVFLGTGTFKPTSTGATSGKFSGTIICAPTSVDADGGTTGFSNCGSNTPPVRCPSGYHYDGSTGGGITGDGAGFCTYSYASGNVRVCEGCTKYFFSVIVDGLDVTNATKQ